MDQKPKLTAVRKPKHRDDIIRQTVEAEAAKAVVIPPLSADELLEAEGKEATQAINRSLMTAAEVFHRIHAEKLWERRGHADPNDYFEVVLGVSYRTVQEAVLIWESHLAISEAVRPAARLALEQIGTYRSAVVAPVIREHPDQWRAWTSLAADRTVSREALQEQVSKARGLPPAHSKKAGDRLYGAFMSLLDKDQREEAETIIKAGMKVGETGDFFVVVMLALIEAGPAWIAQADRIHKGHGNI